MAHTATASSGCRTTLARTAKAVVAGEARTCGEQVSMPTGFAQGNDNDTLMLE